MKALGWILAGVGIGLATYVVLNQPGPQYATGNDDIEDAAGKTSLWGSKQRVAGSAGQIFGKVKQAAGRVSGNDELAAEGAGDELAGTFRDAAGAAGQAIGQTIHEMNR